MSSDEKEEADLTSVADWQSRQRSLLGLGRQLAPWVRRWGQAPPPAVTPKAPPQSPPPSLWQHLPHVVMGNSCPECDSQRSSEQDVHAVMEGAVAEGLDQTADCHGGSCGDGKGRTDPLAELEMLPRILGWTRAAGRASVEGHTSRCRFVLEPSGGAQARQSQQ